LYEIIFEGFIFVFKYTITGYLPYAVTLPSNYNLHMFSFTGNLTIKSLDFSVKLTIYAEESRRYLCFNKKWKLIGSVSTNTLHAHYVNWSCPLFLYLVHIGFWPPILFVLFFVSSVRLLLRFISLIQCMQSYSLAMPILCRTGNGNIPSEMFN